MKSKLLKSSLILILGGFLTKLLGMIIKMVLARLLPTKIMGQYMMLIPSFMLLINLSQCGFPLAITKLIAEEKNSSKDILSSIFPILLGINIILIFSTVLLSNIISNYLLHNPNLTIPIIAMALVIPFTSLSSICRSYFFGKEQLFPHVLSNIIEDLTRLIIYLIGIPYLLQYKETIIICFLVLVNIISEFASTIILFFFLPKKITFQKKDLLPKKRIIKDSLRISLPNTSSRLIGSIAYFLEPILIGNFLLKEGYKKSYIIKEYGILSGYVIPLVLLPSFFTSAISQALLPSLTKDYSKNQLKNVKQKINLSIFLSLSIALPTTIILMKYSSPLLKIIYHTNQGSKYVLSLAPICFLQYISYPLTTVLEATGKSMKNFKINTIASIIRTIVLLITTHWKIGLNCLIISINTSIIITTILLIKEVKKIMKQNFIQISHL